MVLRQRHECRSIKWRRQQTVLVKCKKTIENIKNVKLKPFISVRPFKTSEYKKKKQNKIKLQSQSQNTKPCKITVVANS